MAPCSITLTSRELTELVAPVIPHAEQGGVMPILGSLLIRSRGPFVTALATDRYRCEAQAPFAGSAL